jgi:hypothetical protein
MPLEARARSTNADIARPGPPPRLLPHGFPGDNGGIVSEKPADASKLARDWGPSLLPYGPGEQPPGPRLGASSGNGKPVRRNVRSSPPRPQGAARVARKRNPHERAIVVSIADIAGLLRGRPLRNARGALGPLRGKLLSKEAAPKAPKAAKTTKAQRR